MNRVRSPGEIAISDHEFGGHRYYERMREDGSVESGTVVSSEHPCARHASGYLETGELVRPGVRRVRSNIEYTARGPAAVNSPAYRSGWDAIFAPKGSKASAPS